MARTSLMAGRYAAPIAAASLAVLALACGSAGDRVGFDGDNSANSGSQDQGGAAMTLGSAATAGDAGASCTSGSLNQEGCACSTPGKTQRCYGGDPTRAGIGACTWGTQTCSGSGDSQKWGPCAGYGTPSDEVCTDRVDRNCDGKPGSAAPQCATDAGASPQDASSDGPPVFVQTGAACNSGGHLFVNNISYATPGGDNPIVCSSFAGMPMCQSLFGQGGSFTANCAGTYQVCGRLVSTSGCNIVQTCVSVTVPTDGATVTLAPFPGFAPVANACLYSTLAFSTTLDVTGTTTSGIAVNRPNLVTNIDPVIWSSGGNDGSGGGGF